MGKAFGKTRWARFGAAGLMAALVLFIADQMGAVVHHLVIGAGRRLMWAEEGILCPNTEESLLFAAAAKWGIIVLSVGLLIIRASVIAASLLGARTVFRWVEGAAWLTVLLSLVALCVPYI